MNEFETFTELETFLNNNLKVEDINFKFDTFLFNGDLYSLNSSFNNIWCFTNEEEEEEETIEIVFSNSVFSIKHYYL